jgi:bacterioferritin-associated ferredoxin
MVICLCHRISDRDIAREARAGCASFGALQDETRVATACGVCHDCALKTFEHHRSACRAGQTCGHAAQPATA